MRHKKRLWMAWVQTLVGVGSLLGLVGCATESAGPMIQGEEDVVLDLRNTWHFWEMGLRQAAAQLRTQPPPRLDRPLRLTKMVMPKAFMAGEVEARFAIDAAGRVINLELRNRSGLGFGTEDLVRLTFQSLPRWEFEPPMHMGQPTGYCCVRLLIEHVPQ